MFQNKLYVISDEKFNNYDFFKSYIDKIILKYKLKKENLSFILADNEIISCPIDDFIIKYIEEKNYNSSMIKIRTDLYQERSESVLINTLIKNLLRSDYSRGILIVFWDGKNKRVYDFVSKASENTISIEIIRTDSEFI